MMMRGSWNRDHDPATVQEHQSDIPAAACLGLAIALRFGHNIVRLAGT